ncbi:transposase [Streptomyces sp. CAI-17]|nr:transposase [Streptomyces sp. CAI-17]
MLRRRGIAVTIPERRDQAATRRRRGRLVGRRPAFDEEDYRESNVVEGCFARLKRFRAIATGFDKLAGRCRAGVVPASLILWLRETVAGALARDEVAQVGHRQPRVALEDIRCGVARDGLHRGVEGAPIPLGYPEGAADHRDGEGEGEVLHVAEALLVRHGVEGFLGERADARPLGGDGPGGEGAVDGLAECGVLRRVVIGHVVVEQRRTRLRVALSRGVLYEEGHGLVDALVGVGVGAGAKAVKGGCAGCAGAVRRDAQRVRPSWGSSKQHEEARCRSKRRE